jgi:hypothetical protein
MDEERYAALRVLANDAMLAVSPLGTSAATTAATSSRPTRVCPIAGTRSCAPWSAATGGANGGTRGCSIAHGWTRSSSSPWMSSPIKARRRSSGASGQRRATRGPTAYAGGTFEWLAPTIATTRRAVVSPRLCQAWRVPFCTTVSPRRAQLMGACEGKLHLRFHACRTKNATPRANPCEVLHQRGLADPRLSAQDEHAAVMGDLDALSSDSTSPRHVPTGRRHRLLTTAVLGQDPVVADVEWVGSAAWWRT